MWGALLASDADLNHSASSFRDVGLTIVHGTRDQFASQGMVADYEDRLRSHDIPYRLVTFDGGHRMDRDTLRRLIGPG